MISHVGAVHDLIFMSYDTGGTSYHVLATRVPYLVCIFRVLHIISHVSNGCIVAFDVTCMFC